VAFYDQTILVLFFWRQPFLPESAGRPPIQTRYFFLDMYALCAYNMSVDYQWDRSKAGENLKKHGVDFADAVGVFEDAMALTIEDPVTSEEPRWLTLGTDFGGRLLVVVYTYRGEAVRVISARKATKKEREYYEGKRT
jgi:uncharacterized protein